ncbi:MULTISPECIES: MarR family winged helix-turn-helix transcriptional regulator [Mycobacteriaceae]|uniref:Transcriptional regulator n=1 Tax=Mycolicibacterium brisbanense TaxID=146020 RepID=A0A100VXN0_9MYCO|nr:MULTISPECIES: MarR family transcriptional regulator [Mycobacteriaceae]MCV7157283.1 MarR family transcriptional regulator [Mycolicibacterium brisbanense]GAS87912.1 transcriptional regulator [Mycolicibacterium brisbanense]
MGDILADQPLGFLIYRVTAVLQPIVAARLQPLGLTLPEFVCLRVLSTAPGQSNAELARHINVSPQAMNNVLRGLQERGVVRRPASVASGRALPAELTPDGAALLKQAEAVVHAADVAALANLSADELHELKHLLARAVD